MATQQQKNTSSSSGSAAGLILFLVVILCLGLMGAAGYCEFHLSMAETAMLAISDANPESLSAAQLTAKNDAQFWSMLLTFISWGSLIVACACAVGIYLSMLGRQSAPLRALAQSVKNMAHGDLRTSVWGMERRDAIGELARAIDMARYQFNQLPDMSLMSDKGPVRLRFEGNTKSLFEAMVAEMSRDAEKVRSQATVLTETISKQQEVVGLLSSRVEAVLHNVERRGLDGDKQVKDVLHNMLGSAESLKHAQEHAADQLNRILPFLQERAQGMADITQIAGKQIAQSLQSLTLSERGLKSSADESSEAIKKVAATANELGDRLFGAVNLLQASGKILSETTESTQARFHDVISKLDKDIESVTSGEPPAPLVIDMNPINESLSTHIGGVLAAFQGLEEKLAAQTTAPAAAFDMSAFDVLNQKIDGVATKQDMLEAVTGTIQAIEGVGAQIGSMAVPSTSGDVAFNPDVATKQDVLDAISGTMQAIETMESKIGSLTDMVSQMPGQQATPALDVSELRHILDDMASKVTAPATAGFPDAVKDQMRDQWYQMAAQIEATRNSLSEVIAQNISRLEAQVHSASPMNGVAKIIEQQTGIMTELVSTMGILDAHMQAIRAQVSAIGRRAS